MQFVSEKSSTLFDNVTLISRVVQTVDLGWTVVVGEVIEAGEEIGDIFFDRSATQFYSAGEFGGSFFRLVGRRCIPIDIIGISSNIFS